MSSGPTEMKLHELADACGVSARTVRYYVQRGLLPAPVFRGRDTAYGEEHRIRLLAIKKLQQAYLPLDAIERELERRSFSELREIAEGKRNIERPARVPSREPSLAEGVPSWPEEVPPPRVHPHPRAGGERYERYVLAPGLELHVSENASEDVKRWAERIRRQS